MPNPPIDRDDTDVIGARIGAQLIDLFLNGVLFVAVFFLFGVLGAAVGSAGGGSSSGGAIGGIGFLLALLLGLSYNFLFEAYWDGATPGKRLLGIKVVTENGGDIGLSEAFVRNIPAPFALSWIAYLVALVSMASSDHRQRLFDRLAGTVVVQESAVNRQSAEPAEPAEPADPAEPAEPAN